MRDPEKRVESARAAYATGSRTCSQAVMSAYAAEIGLGLPEALSLVEGLGGGLGGRQAECGAVTAAAYAVSAVVNRLPGATATRTEVYGAVSGMCERFERELGSTRCIELMEGGRPYPLCCPDKVEAAVRAAEAAIAAAERERS